MSQNSTTDRRRAERRQITDRRAGTDRRVLEDRRSAERRVETVATAADRRTGIDRRARALTRMTAQHHIVVYALRRLVSRLYRMALAQPRPGKAETHLAEARTEVLKLDPNLYAVRAALDALSNTPIAKEPEYEQARGMLGQFETPAARAETTKPARKTATRKTATRKKPAARKTARKGASVASSGETADRNRPRKTTSKKTATKRRTTRAKKT